MRAIVLIVTLTLLLVVGFVVVARATSSTVDGVPCTINEQVRYHVHAHLTFLVRGTTYEPPAQIGIHPEHLCFYWLHTHDNSGIIHIEAPHVLAPRLGTFFDIWGQPLSPSRIWKFDVPRPSNLRVFVNGHRYRSNPRGALLYFHTAVTIEIGPPFRPPSHPNFHGLLRG